jgi:poly-gamma-glutamate capsule biosynthesis protein CapA/YwtB (metallophosphatase superfamily)
VLQHGVDVFVAHGVHTLRGVEIYKCKPIENGVGVIRVASASTR